MELTAATEPFVLGPGLIRKEWRAEGNRGEALHVRCFSAFLSRQHNYHDSREETHCLAAGGLGRHIPVAHREEGDGHEPQGRVHFTRHFDGFPAGKKCRVSSPNETVPELMDLVTLSHKTSVDYSCVQLELPCDLLPT